MRSAPAAPVARRQVARSQAPHKRGGWDLLLVCTAVYIATAVGRVHAFVKILVLLKPTLIFAALGIIVYVFQKNPVRSFRAIRHPVTSTIAFIVFWATLGVATSIYKTKSVMFLYDETYKVAILFLLSAAAVRTVLDVRRLLYVYGASIVALALFAIARGGHDDTGRLGAGRGGYDANDFGMVLVAAIPIGIYALGRARQSSTKFAAAVSLVILALTTIKTGSRGAFLGLVAVIGYSLFFLRGIKPAWRVATISAIVVLMGYAASTGYVERMQSIFAPEKDYNANSLTGRVELWKRGIGYMIQNPIFGVGIANFSSAEGRNAVIESRNAQGFGTKWSPPHSAWVQAGAELGVPGLVAFVLLFFYALRALIPIARLGAQPGAPLVLQEGAALASALFGVILSLMVSITFLTQAYAYALWSALGLVVGLVKVLRLQGVPVTRRRMAPSPRGRRMMVPSPSPGPVVGAPAA